MHRRGITLRAELISSGANVAGTVQTQVGKVGGWIKRERLSRVVDDAVLSRHSFRT
jgi:hypothetical protein